MEQRGRRRFPVLFFVAAFLVLFLGRFLKPVNYVVITVAAPFAAVVSGAANAVGDTVTGITQGPRLRDENARLRSQLARALAENVLLQGAAKENEQLTHLLKFDRLHPHMDFLSARAIGFDPNGPQVSPFLFINKGSRSGLRVGMTVVSDRGYFVGTVYEVDPSASKVLLLTNPSSSVGAEDLRTHAGGLVEGRYGAAPVLDAVATSASLQAGDFVVTSGQMNLFPRSILVGQIVSIRRTNEALSQTAELRPAVDLSTLEDVQVIRNFVPSPPTSLLTSH